MDGNLLCYNYSPWQSLSMSIMVMARIAFPDQLDDIEDIDVYVSPEPISDIEGIFF